MLVKKARTTNLKNQFKGKKNLEKDIGIKNQVRIRDLKLKNVKDYHHQILIKVIRH